MQSSSFGHYRVIEKIGEGGMGVVYKAQDTHLDRLAAIKVLSRDRVADPERKRRFVQEAKAASALNHPNIVVIYDIDADQGQDYMAMEYIDGRTLADTIHGHPMKPAEALRVAIDIASALERAHAAGITHRDMKPSNIMIDRGGRVKVLDFGLAKLTDKTETGPDDATVVAPKTVDGAIMGTPHYMSPEQAEGIKADSRTDIFSFGAVLYEMLTGHMAFSGQNVVSVLAAVLNTEPKPLRAIAHGLPEEMERIVARCLRKDRERRYQSIADVRLALEEVRDLPVSTPSASFTSGKQWWYAAAVTAVLAAAAIGWFAGRGSHRASPGPLPVKQLTADTGLTFEPAISQDGKLVAYASDRGGEGHLDIWVQHVSGGEPIRLTRHKSDNHQPTFSPDGGQIAFRSTRDGGGIYVIPALGGTERLIAKSGQRPRFSPDGALILYYITTPGANEGVRLATMHVLPAAGGQPRRLIETHNGEKPIWSPDGKRIVFRGAKSGDPAINWWIVDADGGTPTAMGLEPSAPRTPETWTSDGFIIFSAIENERPYLGRFPIHGNTLGEAERLTSGATEDFNASIAANGLMSFSTIHTRANLWSQTLDANRGLVKGEPRRLTRSTAMDVRPRAAWNVPRVSFLSNRLGVQKVWALDLDSGEQHALTSGTEREDWPLVSSDGGRFVYRSRGGVLVMDRGESPRLLDTGVGTPWCLSRDARFLLAGAATGNKIDLTDLNNNTRTALIGGPGSPRSAVFSHDEKWIAIHSIISAIKRQVFVMPFQGATAIPDSAFIPITDGKTLDRDPEWSPDDNLLYFQTDRDGFRCYMAQRLDPSTKRPAGEPFFVRHFHEPAGTLTIFSSTGPSSPAILADRMIYSLGERTGNVWLMPLGKRN